jgi:uncharacterized protein (TIGR03435 family)
MAGAEVWSAAVAAQEGRAASSANSTQAAKQFEFEVFSIRPHKPGAPPLDRQYMPDGLTATVTLEYLIELAYMPQPPLPWSSLKTVHAPEWIDDWYDIDARVAPQDMAAWQQGGTDIYDSEPLRSALQIALKERCKLAFHMTPIEIPYWNIVVAKHGARQLKETVPGAIKPVVGKSSVAGKGFYIEDGGRRQFVGVSMPDLATVLMRLTKDYPVQNKTGLTGRYDFVLPWYGPQQYPASEISNPIDRMPMDSIGLGLEMGKGPGIVIDINHIERPSAN